MKLECKIFTHIRIHELEREINEFLREKDLEVFSATQSNNAEGYLYITIWYTLKST